MNENLYINENLSSDNKMNEAEQTTISLIPSSYKKIESEEIIDTPSPYQQINQNSIYSLEGKNNDDNNKGIKYDYPSDFFNLISFNWVYNTISLIKKHHKAKFSYLGNVSDKYKSKEILSEIKPIWYGTYSNVTQKNLKENNKSVFPLLMTLVKANLWRIIFSLSMFFVMSALDFFGVLIFQELLGRFKEKQDDNSRWILLQNRSLYELVFLMIVYKLLALTLDRHAIFISELLSFRTKAQLNLLIYDKLLKIPMFNTGKFNEGQIINLFQLDSEAFGELIIYTTYIIMVPFRVIYSVYLLFLFFKLAFIPGIIILIILGVIFAIYGRKEEKLQHENMKATDERMNITSKTFDMIKIIKLYSWEKIFKKKINKKRENEISITKKKLNVQIIISAIDWAVEDILCMICVIFYNLIYGQMEVDKILTGFFVIAGFVEPLFCLPDFFIYLFEAIVSMRRIQDFLVIKEYDYEQIEYIKDKDNVYSIEINHVDFGVEKTIEKESEENKNNNDGTNNDNKKLLYPKEIEMENIEDYDDDNEHLVLSTNIKSELVNNNANSKNPKKFLSLNRQKIQKIVLLKDINLQIIKGEHIGIIGEVGSGKTCLLNAIINNLQVFTKNNSKGNIKLSGKISFVSQNPWILNTTVEENILFFSPKDENKYKKIISICQLEPDLLTLQKGDQTEIGEKGLNLSGGQKARISIARAIYSESEIYIFDDPLSALDAYVGMNLFKGVFNEYLKDKTFIITTHALQYLNFFDRIIYMNEGKIEWSGTYNEIINQDFYGEFVKSLEKKKSGETKEEKKKEEKGEKEEEDENTEEEDSSKTNIIKLERKKSILDLDSKDKISFSALLSLINYSGGFFYVFRILSVNILWKAFEVYSDYYLSLWSSMENLSSSENNTKLTIYTIIASSGIICLLFRQKYMREAYLKCYIQVHDLLIDKLLQAPVNLFHDITPRGNIITRLSKDLTDTARINNILSGTIRVIFQIFGSVLVCAIFNIWTLPLIIFIFIIEVTFSLYILQPIREISRMEGKYRTPLIGAFSESIYGLHIIRAFQYENNFIEKFNKRMNDYFKILIFQSGISGWFGINLDLISFILLTFILISCCFFKEKYNSQSIGLLLTYSINLIEHLFDFMQRFSRLSKILVSLERCDNYTKIAQEKYPVLNSDKNLKLYPSSYNNKINTFISQGKISFNNYSVKYRPNTPLVLKNLTFEINPQEKIGVVGRTGSGKSTLCLCLFRILEADSGKISIDNIDISSIGLEILRKNLTIIPQEPTLIEGTLRENVDPAEIFNDEKILEVLKEVGLDDFLEGKNLDYKIENNGNNISIGEKQLICIARALIKKSRIILMDEATANIDYKTETFLQNSINKELKDCTVITIAHRIKTIINYDRILVLNNGEIVEFDSPQNLLEKKGLFYQLYKESVV